jgi:hypothetical protein
MGFVKLDSGILDSTIWLDRPAREVFITALLMAVPSEVSEPAAQIAVRSLEETGWVVPPGWYGFIPAAGIGIIRRSGVDEADGFAALERLCGPEEASRSPEFEGRRLARVNGGYIVLNFIRYRDKDHTAATRQRRFRDRKRNTVTSLRHPVTSRNITQAEAEAEAVPPIYPPTGHEGHEARKPQSHDDGKPREWLQPETRTLRREGINQRQARAAKPPEPDGTGVASLSPEEILKLPGLKRMKEDE